jgi:DNA-directed RNA polymerase subunit RPC12/RpoP
VDCFGEKKNASENAVSSLAAPIKYFIQGLPFAVLSAGFSLYLYGTFGLLFSHFELFITYLLGPFLVFLFIVGLLNSMVAEFLWNIKPTQSITGFLGQGLLFTLMAAIIEPILFVLYLTFLIRNVSSILITILAFVALTSVCGYLGKNIAAEFEPTSVGKEELASVFDRHVSCPTCNAKFTCSLQDADESGGVHCPQCGAWIGVFDRSPSFR